MTAIVHYVPAGGLVTACNITITQDMMTTSRHRDVTCQKCIDKILYD